jgi:hypothetical protein
VKTACSVRPKEEQWENTSLSLAFIRVFSHLFAFLWAGGLAEMLGGELRIQMAANGVRIRNSPLSAAFRRLAPLGCGGSQAQWKSAHVHPATLATTGKTTRQYNATFSTQITYVKSF